MIKPAVVIAGGGFAGLSAARYFSSYKDTVDVTLIDKNETTHFRPLFPDVISHTVKSSALAFSLLQLKDRYNFSFIKGDICSINFENRTISLKDRSIAFDHLIIATGSQTAFWPKHFSSPNVLRLDSIHDAEQIRIDAISGKFKHIIVCGGGYTGIELATHLKKMVDMKCIDAKIHIVEMVDYLVSTLPVWMQKYTENNCIEMGIDLQLSTRIESISENGVQLSNGKTFDHALCVWTTGLVAPDLLNDLNIPKAEKGRIEADSTLQVKESCFVAGDSACFKQSSGKCTRMSVQSSIDQGIICAENILRLISAQPLKKYEPHDPGFIIPMANGKSCGEVFGLRVKGRVATELHYLMSAYRIHGINNCTDVILNGTCTILPERLHKFFK